MSTTVNAYLCKHVKDLSTLDKLCSSIYNSTKKNKINPKQQLTFLRELSIHVVANAILDESFVTGLIEQMKEFSDQDGDRKLLRMYVYVILEVLSKENKSVDQFKMTEFISYMTKEANSRTNTRQFLAFRTLGILYSFNKANQVNESTNENIFRLMTSSLSGLKYAGKQKKSMFSGGDKDHMLRTRHWTSVMSSLQFIGRVIPKECYANLFYGVLSQYTPLVRSSLLVLLKTVSQLSGDDQSVLELCSMLLDRYRKGKEYLNLEDPLCASYFLRIIGALGHSVNWRHAECKARVLDLFVVAVEFFKNKSVKVICETVSLFVDHSYSWSILVMLLHERTAPRVVPQMVDALSEHIKALPCESISMALVYRTCIKLGRFLISRPPPHGDSDMKNLLSTQHTERDGETLIPLWLALKKHHYKPLLLPCGLPNNLTALIATDVISNANESSYYACSTNVRVARPHMLCEAMKAFIWLAPDKRYCKKEHRQLWTAFAGNLAETVHALAATPYCGDVLLEGLLSNLYARIRASMMVAPRAVHHDVHTTSAPNASHSGDVDLLFDASDDFSAGASLGGGGLPTAHTLQYESMYVDVLLSVAESILTTSQPTNRSLTYMQNLWSFVALLANSTSANAVASVAVSVKAAAQNNNKVDLNNLLSMDFDTSSSSVVGGSGTQEDAYKAHVKYALLRSILSVLEFTKRGVATQPSQQIMLSIHTSALWHLGEHALLWRDVSNVDEYLQAKGVVKATFGQVTSLVVGVPPVVDLFASSAFSSNTSAHITAKMDYKHSALSVIISLLSDASGGGEGNLKKIGVQGLVKVCNSLYLSAATSSSQRSGVLDSALDIYLHHQLMHELIRLFLVHFSHTLTVEGRSAVQTLLTGGQSGGGTQFLKTFLSFVRLYPQDIHSSETVGDCWKASVGKGESDGVLSLLLASTRRGSSVLYVSLVSSLLILFEYTTHVGLTAPSGCIMATITPVAPRKASWLIPAASSDAEEEAFPSVVVTEVTTNEEVEEEQDDGYNFDFTPSQPQSQVLSGDDDFSFSSFGAAPSTAIAAAAPVKINIASVKGVSKLKAPPPQIKTSLGKSTTSMASTPNTTDDNMFDWPASTTSSVAPLSSTVSETPSGFSGWDDAPISSVASGSVADTSFASPADSSASFGWGAEVAPSSVKDAFQASSTVDSGGWGVAATSTSLGFGDDSFAPTSSTAVTSVGDDDMFSFSASSSAPSASLGASEIAASHWASSASPVSAKPVAVVPLLSKPIVPTLSGPKKITPLKKGGGGMNSTSSAVLTPSGNGGDLFGSAVLTPSSTTSSVPDWGATAPPPLFASNGSDPLESDDFLSSFASTTITTDVAPPVFPSTSVGVVSGYGEDFGASSVATTETTSSSGYGGEHAYDFSTPVAAPVLLQPTASSFNLAPVAPSQPAKDLISDLFGEAATSDVALPQLMPLSGANVTATVTAVDKTSLVNKAPAGGFTSGDLFGGGESLFPVTAAPAAAPNNSSNNLDLFGSSTSSVAAFQQSTPPTKTVPLLAKPTALATAKARASALKRTPSISSVGSGSVLGSTGGDDFDIFSTSSSAVPTSGVPSRVVRSTSISSVASHESSQSQHSVFSVQSHQSAAFPATANMSQFGAADTDLFGSSTTVKTTHNASTNLFEDNGWGATNTNTTSAPVARPIVPVLSKPVVPTLTKPSGPAVKINPFAAPVTVGATNVTAKAKAAAAAAAARRGSVAVTGGIHSDLMNLDMPVLTATEAPSVSAPSGWPSATPAAVAAVPRSSFTSPLVDPFASSHNFTTPAVSVAAPKAVDSFAASTDFAPSSTTDSFAPSTAGAAATGWGGAGAPEGFVPQAAYGQQYAQPAAYPYGYGAPAAPGYDPAAAAANAAYYAQQQAYAADPQYAAYYAQQAAAGGYPPQQYGQQQQPQYAQQYPPQQGQYGGYQYPPQGQQQQTPAAPGQQYPANFGYSAYVPK